MKHSNSVANNHVFVLFFFLHNRLVAQQEELFMITMLQPVLHFSPGKVEEDLNLLHH